MHHSHETAHLSQLAGASIGMSMSISITPPSHASASGLHPAAASAAAAAGAAAAAASSSSSNHHYQQQQQQHGKNGSSSNKNKRGPSFWPPNGLESAAFIAKLGREQEQGREQGEEASTSSSRGVGGALATAAKGESSPVQSLLMHWLLFFALSYSSTKSLAGTTGKALPRLFRALLTHPLQLWALACITDPDPRFRAPLATSPWASLAHLR